MNLEELKERHFGRKSQEFCHDGHCNIFAAYREICTCGLIHWIYPYVFGGNEESDKFFKKYYPEHEKDLEKHNFAIGCLRDNLGRHKVKIKKWLESDGFQRIERDLDEGKFFENFDKGKYNLKKKEES